MDRFDRFVIRLGYLPTRRNSSLSKSEAAAQKKEIESFIRNRFSGMVELITIDTINEEGIIFDALDADLAADVFRNAKVDAVFAPHCNFGNEEAVAKVGKKVNKPLLLWGSRDAGPDESGFRSRDTQCGLFATSKALLRYGVPFTYITNSTLNSETFFRGFSDFLAVARVIKVFHGMRVGQIGVRPAPFSSVMCNESELLEKFGIEIVPISVTEIVSDAEKVMESNSEEYRVVLSRLENEFTYLSASDSGREKTAGLTVAIRHWAEKNKVDTVAIQCWNAMRVAIGIYPCVAASLLSEEGLPVSCETDVCGAITLMMLRAASAGETVFLADLTIRHPENDNAELLWHCGNFPHCFSISENELTDKGLHPCGVAGHWEVKGGNITIARMDGLGGEYRLLMGEGRGTTGPKNIGTYLWAEFNDWPLWENRFIYGPYIHHVGLVYGEYSHILYAACRYIPGLDADPVFPERKQLERRLIY